MSSKTASADMRKLGDMPPTKSRMPHSAPGGPRRKSARPSNRRKAKTHTAIGTAKPITKTKKQRVYTDDELGIPKLNMITPAGVRKAKGKKKGKVFVDDQESMMTILAMVNARKEGEIESRMMKVRQMEEIRDARQKEEQARQDEKRQKLEETKQSLRKKHKLKTNTSVPKKDDRSRSSKMNKQVSFV